MGRKERTTATQKLADELAAMTNDQMLATIRTSRPGMGDYDSILNALNIADGDRLTHAMALHACELSGDREYKFAPDAPRAWREHN